MKIVPSGRDPKVLGAIERFEVETPNLQENESGEASKSFVVIRPVGSGGTTSRHSILSRLGRPGLARLSTGCQLPTPPRAHRSGEVGRQP